MICFWVPPSSRARSGAVVPSSATPFAAAKELLTHPCRSSNNPLSLKASTDTYSLNYPPPTTLFSHVL